MKQKLVKAASFTVSVVVLFSVLFAVPVGASGGGDDSNDWIDTLVWLNDAHMSLVKIFWGYTDEMIEDSAQQALEWQSKLLGGSDVSDGSSYLPSSLLMDIPYYTSNEVEGASISGGGYSGGRGGEANAYASGNTVTTSIINATYNDITNNYNYSYYDITNNEYYDITNIYYNQTYNTYNIQTTNNYNYYVTYSPTYINITYLDSASNKLTNNTYFYELPDGRNSWDLTADEVFGMYFIYDVGNYDMVVEDDATLGLYHFDGNLKNESAYNSTASYISGPSYNFVDHGAFDAALYWDGSEHALSFSTSVGGSTTYEVMLYLASGGTVPDWTYPDARLDTDGPVSGWGMFFPEDSLSASRVISSNPSQWYWGDYNRGQQIQESVYAYEVTRLDGYILNIGGVGYLPVYRRGVFHVHVKSYHNYSSYERTFAYRTLSYTAQSSECFISLDSEHNTTLPVGSWHYLSVSGGQLYIDGMAAAAETGAATFDGITIFKPSSWGNYWMLDEFRMSAGTLFTGSYTPPAAPYDTNKVMVLPETGTNGDIAVKTSIAVGNTRIGGARPTYPAEGDVFVSVTKSSSKHTVESIQQYQAGGWVSVDGAIYSGGEWKTLKGYDLSSYTVDEDDFPSGGGGGDGGGGDGGNTNTDDDRAWWEVIADALGGLVSGLLSIIASIASGIATIVTSVFDALFSLVSFVGRFGEFIAAAFSFIPPEITAVIVAGLSLAVILMIVNFFR